MTAVELRRWSREEYDRMIAAGVFAPGEQVELIDGEILRMVPQGSVHFTAIVLAGEALRRVFGAGFHVRTQGPLALGLSSEPEPDVAVVRGAPRDYRDAHPDTSLLIVEVAGASIDYDRRRKASLYARAGIRDYWIVNLEDRCLEVYRDPDQGAYRSRQRFHAGDLVSPLAVSDAAVPVEGLLP
jgi:Uma2 family endonuclease